MIFNLETMATTKFQQHIHGTQLSKNVNQCNWAWPLIPRSWVDHVRTANFTVDSHDDFDDPISAPKKKTTTKQTKKQFFSYARHVWIVPFSCFISIFIPQRRRRRAQNSFGNPKKSFLFFLFFPSMCLLSFWWEMTKFISLIVYGQSTGLFFLRCCLLAHAADTRTAVTSNLVKKKRKKFQIESRGSNRFGMDCFIIKLSSFFFIILPLVLEDK